MSITVKSRVTGTELLPSLSTAQYSSTCGPGVLVATVAVEPDTAKQKALWKTAQQKLMANVCGIPVYEQPQIWARRASLEYGFPLKGSLSLGPVIDEGTYFKQ